MKRYLFIAALVLGILYLLSLEAGPGLAGETGTVHSITLPVVDIQLKEGPGKDKTAALCNICHSLDYITTQPPFTADKWGATVTKMIHVYGAPVNEEDAKTITHYLGAQYGKGGD
ncbi:MAG: cytochrome c [bacterium]